MSNYLPYNPGVLPKKPPPSPGETINIKVSGLPPYKDEHFSIRNLKHKIFCRFKLLREISIRIMDGRAPYQGAVQMDFIMYASGFEENRRLVDYMGGIMDTLDGSHGASFTYLPIVYEDDCQACTGRSELRISDKECYEIEITFLSN
jgi:hypothetical protein